MNKTKLIEVYKTAYKKNKDALAYYTLDQFIKGVELLRKDIINCRIILHVDVSRSGMSRRSVAFRKRERTQETRKS